MESFEDLLNDDPLLYFDTRFLNQNNQYWTHELFNHKSEKLIKRLSIFFYDYIKLQNMYDLFSILKKTKLNMSIPAYMCKNYQNMKISRSLTFEHFLNNFMVPSCWELDKRKVITEYVLNHLSKINELISSNRWF